MTTITLQEYHQRIDKLIDENMLTDAIAHCRHILESHSSHIDTYRLLAKTLLEQHDYDGAGDLFQRVLSAEPNDFVAHVGLSIIRSEESQVESALWHLQRAFEIEPYNAAIQEELRRHYVQFSDLAVDRIPLTSGALARLYVKGELYQQAVQELRQTIQHSQDRVDLEVLLAEALWRNDQRVDAEEVCLNVLQKLPNCIVVNAILSEIWLQTGRIGESQKYLRRLVALASPDKESLDLDTPVGRAFRSDGAPPLPDQVELEFKGDAALVAAGVGTTGKGPSADWMSEMTFDSDAAEKFEYEQLEVAESPSGMHNYDWMAEVNDDLTRQENLPVESEWFMDEELKAEPSLEDDWLADVGVAAMGTAVSDDEFDMLFADDPAPLEPSAAMEPEGEDWFLTQSEGELQAEETFASEQSVPEWLIPLVNEPDLLDEDDEIGEGTVGSDWFAERGSDGGTDAALPTTDSKVPDWLSNLVDDAPAQPGMDDFAEVDLAAPTAVAHEQDDWMIDEHAEDHWDEGDYTEEEMPDWLHDAAAFGDADAQNAAPLAEEEAFVPAEAPQMDEAEEMPDWLRKQTGELDAELVTGAGSGEMDDWLTGAPATTDDGTELEEGLEASPFAGWLSDEPEEHAAAIPGAAALGLTSMFAALDDDLPEEETGTTAVGMDELDDLFAEVADEAGTAVPSTGHDAETDEDDWLSGVGLAAEEEPAMAVDWADDTADALADPLDNLRQSLGDVADASAADIGLDSDWLTMPDDVWADDLAADNLADLTVNTTDVAAEFSIFGEQAFADDDLAIEEEEGIPDWLLGNEQARSGKAEETVMGDDEEDEAALEPEDDFATLGGGWLSDFTGDDDEEELPDDHALDVTPELEDVPDWLAGFESDAFDDEEEELLDGTFMAEASADEASAAEPSVDEPSVDEPSVDEPSVDEPSADEPSVDEAAELDADDYVPDWLSDGGGTAVPVSSAPSGGMTSWLNSFNEPEKASESEATESMSSMDVPDIPSEELFATDRGNLPDWLSSAEGDDLMVTEDDSNLPDWLLDGATDVPEQLDSEDLFATDEVAAFDVLDEPEGPGEFEDDLFMESDEEEADEGLTAVGLTALLSSINDEPATLASLESETDISWLDGMDEEASDAALDAIEEGDLDWLTEGIEEEESIEEMATAVSAAAQSDSLEMEADAPAEDLDDAISWLEELASQQETPVDELSTVAQSVLAEELTMQDEGVAVDQDMTTDDDFDEMLLDDVLDEALAEAFPSDMIASEAESDMAEEEADGGSWLDVLMAEEEEAEALSMPPDDDPEAAMAWLEGLAAKQGASLDELPSLRQQSDLDGLVDEAQADLDEALAWMDNLEEEPQPQEEWPELDEELLAAALSGAAIPSATKSAVSQPQADDELTEVLDFLEEQVRAEGITPTVSAGTAVVSDEELSAALDWLEETAVEEALPDVAEDAEIELIEELTAAEMAVDVYDLPEDDAWEEDSWDWEQQESIPSITDLLTVAAKPAVAASIDEEDADLLDMPDDPDEAMEWLARIATDAGESEQSVMVSSIAEVDVWDEPTDEGDLEIELDEQLLEPAGAALHTAVTDSAPGEDADMLLIADDLDISDMPDDPDEAMNWLLNMAEGDGDIDFDMEPPPITPSEDAAFAVATSTEAVEDSPELEPVVEGMDTAVDELAMAAEAEDDASWLEDMLGDDFEIDFDMEPPPITPSEDAAFAVAYSTETAEDSPELKPVVEGMDTAVDELAMAAEAEDDASWLEDMLDDDFEIDFDMEPPPITPSEDAAFAVVYDTTEAPVAEQAPESESFVDLDDDDIIDTVPEDPDEAMAWLQKIADEQTDSLAPAIAPDDTTLPAWLQMDGAEEQNELDAMAETADAEGLEFIEDLDIGLNIDDDLSDSLPDWLATDGRSSGTGQTGWLTSVEDVDVISWLAAEDEATAVDFDDVMLPETGELRPLPAIGRLPALTPVESDMPAESFEVQPLETAKIDTDQLPDVRVALAEKKYEEAAAHYQQLISSGTATLGLIAELESLADEYPAQADFRRLLGDAYMRNGQLQKALNAYRVALDQL